MTLSPLYYLYVAAFAVAAVGCFASIARIKQVEDADTRWGLLALLLTSGSWGLAHVGFLVAPSIQLKLISYTFGLIVGLAAVGAWLYFCSAYTGRAYHLNPIYRRLSVAVFLVLIAVKITNPLHHEYFTVTTVTTPFPHLSIQNGPLHWAAMGLSYALAFVGYFMLLELFTEIDLDTRPFMVLVGITGLPVILDIVGYATPFLIDITYEPLGVAVFAVGVAFVYLERFEAVQLAAERDVPIIALDRDNRIRDTNRTARTLFPALSSARGEPLDIALPAVSERLDSESPILEIQQDSTSRYLRVTESPFGTAKIGLGRTLVFTDVTEREQYRQELERQNERLDTFASMVSHDLRNPLTVAMGRLELLREELNTEDSNLAAIGEALERMEELIDEIHTLARQGQPVENPKPISLESLVTDCWEMVETTNAELDVEADLLFRGDRERLKRLFENLFRNAVGHGGPEVTVTVGTLSDQSGFYIADNGPGIPESEREQVFEVGYTTRRGGTGFGLAIVQEIVAAHGWEISVTESSSGGARFEISGVKVVE